MEARIGEHGNYITKEAMLQKKKITTDVVWSTNELIRN